MEVILVSVCMEIFIFLTVFNLIRILKTAYNQRELNFIKFFIYVSTVVAAGVFFAAILPFGYQNLFHLLVKFM